MTDFRPISEADTLLAALRQSADPAVVAAIERLIRGAGDGELCRINGPAMP